MALMKFIVLAMAFVASGGILYSEYFRKNTLVKGIAAAVGIVAFGALIIEVTGGLFRGHQLQPTAELPAPIETGSLASKAAESLVVVPLAQHITSKALGFSADGDQLYVIPESGPIVFWDRATAMVKGTKLSARKGTSLSRDRHWLADVEKAMPL